MLGVSRYSNYTIALRLQTGYGWFSRSSLCPGLTSHLQSTRWFSLKLQLHATPFICNYFIQWLGVYYLGRKRICKSEIYSKTKSQVRNRGKSNINDWTEGSGKASGGRMVKSSPMNTDVSAVLYVGVSNMRTNSWWHLPSAEISVYKREGLRTKSHFMIAPNWSQVGALNRL